MSKKIQVKVRITEINVNHHLGIVVKENPDGTSDIILKFANPDEEKKFFDEAKRLNLLPEGYLLLLALSGNLSRKGIMDIADKYGLKK